MKKSYSFDYATAYDKSQFHCFADSLSEARKQVPSHLKLLTTGEEDNKYEFETAKRLFGNWHKDELAQLFTIVKIEGSKENGRAKAYFIIDSASKLFHFGGQKEIRVYFTYGTEGYNYHNSVSIYDWEDVPYPAYIA